MTVCIYGRGGPMFSLFASYLVPHYMLFHADIHSHLRSLVLISIYCFLSIDLVFFTFVATRWELDLGGTFDSRPCGEPLMLSVLSSSKSKRETLLSNYSTCGYSLTQGCLLQVAIRYTPRCIISLPASKISVKSGGTLLSLAWESRTINVQRAVVSQLHANR